MQISEIKLKIFRHIDKMEDTKLLQMYDLLISDTQKQDVDFWNLLNNWQKNDIELGLTDLKQGKGRNFDEVMQEYQ